MGGRMGIYGGMTRAEYQAQLDEQRAYNERQEKEHRAFYAEQLRQQEERARREAQKAADAEKARLESIERAENMLQKEAAAQAGGAEQAAGVVDEEEDAFDFYNSLYQGLEQRPE